jgi:hypothetical protein
MRRKRIRDELVATRSLEPGVFLVSEPVQVNSIALGLMGRGVVQAAPLVTDRIPITAAVSGGLELLRDEPEKHLKILVRPGGTR